MFAATRSYDALHSAAQPRRSTMTGELRSRRLHVRNARARRLQAGAQGRRIAIFDASLVMALLSLRRGRCWPVMRVIYDR